MTDLMIDPDEEHDRVNPRVYTRYSEEQKTLLIARILELRYPTNKGEKQEDWNKIADACNIARSTLLDWRKSSIFKQLEQERRVMLREEARSNVASMGEQAVLHVMYLMEHASSDFVQLEAARELIRIARIEEAEEKTTNSENEMLVVFLQKVEELKTQQAALGNHGIDMRKIIDMPVGPGGRLPEMVTQQGAFIAEQAKARPSIEDDYDPEEL